MMFSSKLMLSATTALALLPSAGALAQKAGPAAVEAAPAEAAPRTSDAEIVVTAQRRQQRLLDVPISVSAFSASMIEKAHITEAKDYLALAPNISFTEDGEKGNRSINIAIRGVSNVDLGEQSTQQSIGYYIDELSTGSSANGTLNPQLLDIERIEVLRGPQGTYFGRNASGGAINITTKKPTDSLYAEGGLEYGRFDTQKVYGIFNAPLASNLFFRGLASYEKSDGLIRNLDPRGTPNSGYKNLHLRGAVRFVPTENLTWDLSVDYARDRNGMDATVPSGVLDLDTKSIFGSDFQAIDEGEGFYPANQRNVRHNTREWNNNSATIINNRLTWKGDDFSIHSITGYIDSSNSRQFDQDNISVDALYRHNRNSGRSFSQELRVQSEGTTAIEWVVGGLYANDRIRQFNSIRAGTETSYTYPDGTVIGLLPPIPPEFRVNENNKIFKTESIAAFADATWHVSSKIDLVAGGRYTHDKISNRNFGVVAFESPVPDIAGSKSFSDFSPRLLARFKFNRDNNVYASVSKGYKAGGIDINSGFASPFRPETLWNYEVGLKGDLLDHSVQYGLSFFYLKWKDLQVQTNYLAIPGDISSATELTLNAARATNKGFEFDVHARLSSTLRWNAAFGYLDSTFKSFPDAVLAGGNQVDLTGYRLPKTPRYTISTSLDYDAEVADGVSLYLHPEINFRSAAPGDLEGVAAVPLALPSFPYQPKAYAVVNMFGGVRFGRFEIGGYVNNLFKEDYYTGTADNFGLGGIRLRPHPRTFGATAKVKFGADG
ncbi:TonB-dependent receptor [Sphingomonas sp. YL-JM2C]